MPVATIIGEPLFLINDLLVTLGLSAEQVKPVKGYDDYYVTASGLVISTKGKKPRVIKPTATNDGHLRVRLSHSGKVTGFYLHQLVLSHLVGERPSPDHISRHLDGNRLNNRLSNLEWSTHGVNCADPPHSPW